MLLVLSLIVVLFGVVVSDSGLQDVDQLLQNLNIREDGSVNCADFVKNVMS